MTGNRDREFDQAEFAGRVLIGLACSLWIAAGLWVWMHVKYEDRQAAVMTAIRWLSDGLGRGRPVGGPGDPAAG